MLSTAATDTLGRIAHHPVLDELLHALRRGAPQESLAGLSDPVKALVSAVITGELRRPIIVIAENGRQAEAMIEPLQFFCRAIGGSSIGAVALLPALDALPGQRLQPHPELLETRAAALWRFASGQVSALVAPLEATLLSFAPLRFYERLSRTLVRDQEIALEEVLAHLHHVGYTRTDLVDMPGQYAVRGGILDVFPPEMAMPARIELLGDTVESLREFDPETQRSTAPITRVILPPLTEFPLALLGENREGSVARFGDGPDEGDDRFEGRAEDQAEDRAEDQAEDRAEDQ